MPTFAPQPLAAFSADLFAAAGVPPDDARLVANSLVDANLCGHDSHGVMRVPQYLGFLQSGQYRADAAFTILNETPAVVAADGGWGLGQVQAYRLLDRLIPKAKALGVASGTLRNCGHIGRLGEYAEAAARENLALLAMVNSHGAGRRVAPPGGTQGRIGTNPICFGAPTTGDPVILDFGTSAVAEGKVRVHFQKGEPVPAGWLLDADGQPTTDPAALYATPPGSIVPSAGNRRTRGSGWGYSWICSAADSVAAGAPTRTTRWPASATRWCSPRSTGGVRRRRSLLAQADGLTGFVRGTPTAAGQTITLPGDPERRAKEERTKTGIAVPDGTWKLIADAATKLGVSVI